MPSLSPVCGASITVRAFVYGVPVTRPWFSSIAPGSWLARRDVDDGRTKFNVSEWDTTYIETDDLERAITGVEMPPLQYSRIHRGTSLSKAEADALVSGLRATLAGSPPGGRPSGEGSGGGSGRSAPAR